MSREGEGIIRVIPLIVLFGCCYLLLAANVAQGEAEKAAKLRPDVIAYWMGPLHRCEQPDSWDHRQYKEYKGGLGISNGAWNWWAGELGLKKKYPTAGHAPPLVQVRVADYGWRMYRGNWGAMRNGCAGYPPR